MSNERVNAHSVLYETGTLNGIPMIGTGARLDHGTVPAGYYCYDVFIPGEFPEVKNAAVLSSLSDRADGSIILAESLDFQGKEELIMENLILHEDCCMIALDEFMRQSEEQNAVFEQEQNSGWSQSM